MTEIVKRISNPEVEERSTALLADANGNSLEKVQALLAAAENDKNALGIERLLFGRTGR